MARKGMALVLCVLLVVGLLSGCFKATDVPSSGDSPTPKAVVMGRYVENEILSAAETYYIGSFKDAGERIVFYVMERVGEREVNIKRNVITKDGTVESVDVDWLNRLSKEGANIHNVSENAAGVAYAVYMDAENAFKLARFRDGAVEYIDMPNWVQFNFAEGGGGVFSLDETEEKTYMPTGVIALDGGFLALYDIDGVFEYDESGNLVRQYAETGYTNCAVLFENRLALFEMESGLITVYDVATGEALETATYSTDAGDFMGIRSGFVLGLDAGGLFVVTGEGVYRHSGGEWNMVVDGGLTSLGMQNLMIAGVMSDGESYYAFLNGTALSVARFEFDESMPAEPAITLEVFSLRDNNTIRQTIGEFQRENPDVRVNFRIGLADENSANEEDVIRALNTEILNGKGPDLLVLDGLPVDSYIEKGVLGDISGLADELQNAGMFEALANAFKRGGAVYGLPTRFSVPVMVGDKSHLAEITSLSDLVRAVRDSYEENVNLLRISDSLYSENGIMMDYYGSCVDNWMNEDNSIDENALAVYLSDMLALNNVIKENAPENNGELGVIAVSGGGRGSETFDMSPLDLRDGKALMSATTLGGVFALRIFCSSLNGMDNMGLAGMFNQKKFCAQGTIGVVASGKQTAIAEQFVKLALSRTVQDAYLYDGFPVNRESLKLTLDEHMEDNTTDMGFIEFCEGLETPVVIDNVIRAAVEEQVPALIAGEVTPEEAAKNIVAATKLYLSE